MKQQTFDYLIVGAGSAGCVLANRLSEDPNISVCLVEAGGGTNNLLVNMPMGFGITVHSKTFSWQFNSTPEQASHDRSYYHPRGKGLGGSSAINGMVYIRGQHQDFDDWAAAGANGWDWESVRPYFIKSESYEHGANHWHGDRGPLNIGDVKLRLPIEQTIIDAGVAAGLPKNEDFNGVHQAGIGRYQAYIHNGKRVSGSSAYLKPIRSRKNLTILKDSMAQGVEFDDKLATGLVVKRRNKLLTLKARREVILSAGAFQSPHLLQLSGIGPADKLKSLGLDVVSDIPQVGQNLHDHVGAPMAWKLNNKNMSLNSRMLFPRLMGEAFKYLLTSKGPMSMPASTVGIFADSKGEGGRPDLQFHCLPMSGDLKYEMETGKRQLSGFPGITMMPYPSRPKSRGFINVCSPDPNLLPEVTMNYFKDPEDMEVLVRGMHLAQRIADTEPLASLVESRAYPAPDENDPDSLAEFARAFSHTGYHPVGTCRMGSDAASVVDCDLKVRGVKGLRVVDASVMPVVVSGNTNAAAVMIAEKISEKIIADQRS